jgi:hypothetical protein
MKCVLQAMGWTDKQGNIDKHEIAIDAAVLAGIVIASSIIHYLTN